MPKKQTLLLCFIHGFKGDEETFFDFPDNLAQQVSANSPTLEVQTRVYPKYETRGDLAACVSTFKEWLGEQVCTISPQSSEETSKIEHDVGVILVAHSMGGFVATDALFSILDGRSVKDGGDKEQEKLQMSPLIHGILLFDSPLNGLARSMFAYGAFAQYQNISGVLNLLSTVGSSLAIGTASASAPTAAAASSSSAIAAGAGGAVVTSQASSWRRWQTLASRTGAYGAIMAGGVAAYVHRESIFNSLSSLSMPSKKSVMEINYRDNITQGLTYVSRDAIGEGFTWMASHLKFVGALMKTGQLTKRLERLEGLRGVGVVNLFTSLGENGVWNGGYFVPKRTFCAVPAGKEGEGEMWREVPNMKAENEIFAHCNMFKKERNAGYDFMLEFAQQLVCEWALNGKEEVKDEYKPSREVLHRSMSEHTLWDDDGKVLAATSTEDKSVEEVEGGQDESEDEKQLQAILTCANMPWPEGGDEASVMEALGIPLPIDEDVDASMKVVAVADEATKVALPADEGAEFGDPKEVVQANEEDGKISLDDSSKGIPKSDGWFRNPLAAQQNATEPSPEGSKGKKDTTQVDQSKNEAAQSRGWFKNPLPMLYRGKKAASK